MTRTSVVPPEQPKSRETNCKSVLGSFGLFNTQFWTSYCFDPYVNCEFNCIYCHTTAKKLERNKEFNVPVYAKMNSPEILRHELSTFKRKGVVRLSLSTDPYQPLEGKYRITRELLEILTEQNWPFAIGTKSDLILRDIDLLEAAAKKSWCCVAVTITTLDEELASVIEPNAPPPKRRLEVIKALSERGVNVGLWIIPLIPYVTDQEANMASVIEAAVKNGAKFVLSGSLDMRGAERFKRLLTGNRASLLEKYSELYAGKPSAPSCGNMDSSYLSAAYMRFEGVCQEFGVKNYMPHFCSRKQALLFYIHNYGVKGKPLYALRKASNFMFPAKEIFQAVHIRLGRYRFVREFLRVMGYYPK